MNGRFPFDSPMEPLIKNMRVGECGYTLPWAIEILEDGRGYINSNYPCEERSGGTLCTYIEKRADGYVWVNASTVPPHSRVRKEEHNTWHDMEIKFYAN
jgi:hypothetical protein